jgi:hypothetical protein
MTHAQSTPAHVRSSVTDFTKYTSFADLAKIEMPDRTLNIPITKKKSLV